MSIRNMVLIGSGNVGYHLGRRLFEKGVPIQQVYSRKLDRAKELANLIEAEAINQWEAIQSTADLYILAVPDSTIASVAKHLQSIVDSKALVVHCSGATPSTVLQPYFSRFGIFYPLQTFSKERPVHFEAIPICVDAPSKSDSQLLYELGTRISQSVHFITDTERASLHVAAVFVNNFTNYLFHIGHQICEQERVPFELLQPLILETAAKIQEKKPLNMQTGPAIRGDASTIERHLLFLGKHPEYHRIYQLMSQAIQHLPKA